MNDPVPESLAIVAGRGVYPLLLAESARRQGVRRLVAVAFRGETDPSLARRVDRIEWVRFGQYGRMLDALGRLGARHTVMAGHLTPTHFFRMRLDRRMLDLLGQLRTRNAETVFGAVAADLGKLGIEVLPASSFMQAHLAEAGLFSRRAPTAAQESDIALGRRVARAVSALDIGQTVVVREGVVLAVEAFEGTDQTILRAGRLGGPGCVVVKLAKTAHDMRFDIPAVGMRTLRVLRKARAAVLAVEAGRAILLERDALVGEADRIGLCFVVLAFGGPDAGGDAPALARARE